MIQEQIGEHPLLLCSLPSPQPGLLGSCMRVWEERGTACAHTLRVALPGVPVVLSGVSCHSISSLDPLYPRAGSQIPQETKTTPHPLMSHGESPGLMPQICPWTNPPVPDLTLKLQVPRQGSGSLCAWSSSHACLPTSLSPLSTGSLGPRVLRQP